MVFLWYSLFYNIDGSVTRFYGSLLNSIAMSKLSSLLMVSGLLFREWYYFVFILGLWLSLVCFRLVFECIVFFLIVIGCLFFSFSVVLKFPVQFLCHLFQVCVLMLFFYCFFTCFNFLVRLKTMCGVTYRYLLCLL